MPASQHHPAHAPPAIRASRQTKKNPGTWPGQSNREVHMMTRICDGIS